MKAGFAQAVITPPLGSRMEGWGFRDRAHGADGVLDDLFVRVLYVEHEGESTLILAYDHCFFSRPHADRLKGALGRHFDLTPRRILINSTHTHAGVWTSAYGDTGGLVPDWPYLDELEKRTVRAAARARDSASEASVWAGVGRTSVPVSRRRPDGKGGVTWQPYPEGRVCDLLPVCEFRAEGGGAICVLFSVSCHPSTVGGWQFSGDYPGVACAALNARLGGEVAMFVQGAGGDTKARVIADMDNPDGPVWRQGTAEDIQVAGGTLAREVEAVLAEGLAEYSPDLRTALIDVDWPLEELPDPREEFAAHLDDEDSIRRAWAEQNLALLDRGLPIATAANLLVHGVQLGEGLRVVAVEGELVGELGLQVAGAFADGVTFPLGFSNGSGLYLPTAEMLAEGGYEAESYYEYGFASPLQPVGEKVLGEAIQELQRRGIA